MFIGGVSSCKAADASSLKKNLSGNANEIDVCTVNSLLLNEARRHSPEIPVNPQENDQGREWPNFGPFNRTPNEITDAAFPQPVGRRQTLDCPSPYEKVQCTCSGILMGKWGYGISTLILRIDVTRAGTAITNS